MKKQIAKACLFGGTLAAAGLSASVVNAQSFQNTGGVIASAYAYDYANYSYEGVFTGGADFSASGFDSFVSTSGGSGSWGWDAGAGTWELSIAQGADLSVSHNASLLSIFTVDDDSTLTISWDFSNADTSTAFTSEFAWFLLESDDASFQPSELIDGLDADGPPLSTPSGGLGLVGSATIQLDSTKTYQLTLDLIAGSGAFAQSGSITASLGPVPSPAGLGLMACAMAASARRRRP